MEKVIREVLHKFSVIHNLTPKMSTGLLRSSTTQLVEGNNDWTLALDENQPIDIIYSDFSRAFDKIHIRRLLFKLKFYTRCNLLGWIETFLLKCTFRVRVGSNISSQKCVASGMPQGSVLGPLLFLIYTAELLQLLTAKCSLFADDRKIYNHSENQAEEPKHHRAKEPSLVTKITKDRIIPLRFQRHSNSKFIVVKTFALVQNTQTCMEYRFAKRLQCT